MLQIHKIELNWLKAGNSLIRKNQTLYEFCQFLLYVIFIIFYFLNQILQINYIITFMNSILKCVKCNNFENTK